MEEIMRADELFLHRGIVLCSGLVYWSGVWIQARRVRRKIGRSPNVRPHGLKEKLLWTGWAFVVLAWLTLPFLAGREQWAQGLFILPSLVHPVGLVIGATMTGLG